MRSTPSLRRLPNVAFGESSNVRLSDDGPENPPIKPEADKVKNKQKKEVLNSKHSTHDGESQPENKATNQHKDREPTNQPSKRFFSLGTSDLFPPL